MGKLPDAFILYSRFSFEKNFSSLECTKYKNLFLLPGSNFHSSYNLFHLCHVRLDMNSTLLGKLMQWTEFAIFYMRITKRVLFWCLGWCQTWSPGILSCSFPSFLFIFPFSSRNWKLKLLCATWSVRMTF